MRIIKIIMPVILLLFLGTGTSRAALPKPAEMQSIQISPDETMVGKHPEIIGTVKAVSSKAPGETVEINVVASLARPDHAIKSWIWKKIHIKAGETKVFSIPKEYDVKLTGAYKVDFGVYSTDMRPLSRLSKFFTVVDPARPPVKAAPQAEAGSKTGIVSGKSTRRLAGDRRIGIGAYANTVNTAAGATMLLWPYKYVGLQGSYTMGEFTTAEGRLLMRFPLSSGINPYAGVGYASVSTERTVDIIGIKSTFKDSGVSGVIGAEIPLGRRLYGYVEIGGAAIDLKKEITFGGQTGDASIKYSTVTLGLGIVYFFF